jgi:hypothetical protein
MKNETLFKIRNPGSRWAPEGCGILASTTPASKTFPLWSKSQMLLVTCHAARCDRFVPSLSPPPGRKPVVGFNLSMMSKPFILYTTSLPPLPNQPGLSLANSRFDSDPGLSSLSPLPTRKDRPFDTDLMSYKGSQRVSLAGYSQALGDSIKLLVPFLFITIVDRSESVFVSNLHITRFSLPMC